MEDNIMMRLHSGSRSLALRGSESLKDLQASSKRVNHVQCIPVDG